MTRKIDKRLDDLERQTVKRSGFLAVTALPDGTYKAKPPGNPERIYTEAELTELEKNLETLFVLYWGPEEPPANREVVNLTWDD